MNSDQGTHTLRNLGIGAVVGVVLGVLLIAGQAIGAYTNMLAALF